MIDIQNSSTAYNNLHIGYTISFGLEHEDGSLVTAMVLIHSLHPISDRSRNKHRNLWVGRVSSCLNSCQEDQFMSTYILWLQPNYLIPLKGYIVSTYLPLRCSYLTVHKYSKPYLRTLASDSRDNLPYI